MNNQQTIVKPDMALVNDIIHNLKEYDKTPFSFPGIDQIDLRYKWLAMLIRDPRMGLGYKELGRTMMILSGVSPVRAINAGRADDLFLMGYTYHLMHKKARKAVKNPYWDFLMSVLTNPSSPHYYLVKKWMPRERKNKLREMVKLFRYKYKLDGKSYRKLIALHDTTEALTSKGLVPRDYSMVPYLAFKKHTKTFARTDKRFGSYVLKGIKNPGMYEPIHYPKVTINMDRCWEMVKEYKALYQQRYEGNSN